MSELEQINFGNGRTGQVFYYEDLPKALEQAQEYTVKEGNVATMQDIAQARIIAPKDSFILRNWFTTATGEYKGLSKQGSPVYVVSKSKDPTANPLIMPGRIRQAKEEGLIRNYSR